MQQRIKPTLELALSQLMAYICKLDTSSTDNALRHDLCVYFMRNGFNCFINISPRTSAEPKGGIEYRCYRHLYNVGPGGSSFETMTLVDYAVGRVLSVPCILK